MSTTLGSVTGRLGKKPVSVSPAETEKERAREAEAIEQRKAAASRQLHERARAVNPVVRVPRGLERRADFPQLSWIKGESRRAVTFCEEFADAEFLPSRGPLLMGPSGCGKTHLLWAMARRIAYLQKARVGREATAYWNRVKPEIEKGETKWPPPVLPVLHLRVTDGSELAHDLRSTVEKRNLDDVISGYRQDAAIKAGGTGVLFVDDVEIAKMSDWLHEELYRIINYRYAEAMPTAFATNLSPDELRDALGDRLARRIVDMTEPFVMGVA